MSSIHLPLLLTSTSLRTRVGARVLNCGCPLFLKPRFHRRNFTPELGTF
uniref:Uncharacterized protein n=1 Tax=Anguilla anguilla TaxID=7936 RepID=A0A0E9PT40_ANGAN